MKPPPMPEHWFNAFLAQLTPPGRSPLRPHQETLELWRRSMREVAQRQWAEAFLTGAVEGMKYNPGPHQIKVPCDQEKCRLLDLPWKVGADAAPEG